MSLSINEGLMSIMKDEHQFMSFAENGQAEGACSLTLLEQEGQGQEQPRRGRTPGVPVNNFIQKTYAILQEKRYESIVSWADSDCPLKAGSCSEQGRPACAFRIHNVKAFEEIVLPMYFKHSNMSSFVRQLNMYSFHKVRGDKNEYEFEHDKFLRNRSDLLCEIKRKQVDSTNCIPSISLIPPPPDNQDRDRQRERTEQRVGERERERTEKGVSLVELRGAVSQVEMYESPEKRESSIAKVSSNDPELQNAKLVELQEMSRSLKKAKQTKMGILKQLTSANRTLLTHKFNKVIMSALSSKIELESSEPSRGDEGSDLQGMHSLIEHIMDQSPPRSYEDYLKETDNLLHLSRAARLFPAVDDN